MEERVVLPKENLPSVPRAGNPRRLEVEKEVEALRLVCGQQEGQSGPRKVDSQRMIAGHCPDV